jgi:uncharacterized membrane protein
MFEFLFKYPASVFSRGQFVLLGGWPVWLLGLGVVAAGVALAWHLRRSPKRLTGRRPAVIWLLQTLMAAVLLFLLWHPALSVATLRPQQNVVAVLIDDSGSMAMQEGNATRLDQAREVLQSGVLDRLRERFQVRLYRFGAAAERIEDLLGVAGAQPSTRIGEALQAALADTATLPLGAMIVLTDGADNTGGIDRETIQQLRQRRVPVHPVGFGREVISPDAEIVDAVIPVRTLAESRLSAQVTIRQHGLTGGKSQLTVRDAGRVVASVPVVFRQQDAPVTQTVNLTAGAAGVKTLQFTLEPLAGEVNAKNNSVARVLQVEAAKPRILYFEGEPRWEFKFIRRALGEDSSLQLTTILRTTQNKFYRQGIANATELEDGFPARAEELFEYAALIIGASEASYFTREQQTLIREFANRRGGGVLFLGGRSTLGNGGYAQSELAEMLPVRVEDRKTTFHRDQAGFELTPQGLDSLICRLVDDPAANAERWRKMPLLADFQEVGEAKPGAVTLLLLNAPGRRKSPLLTIQAYGRGRTAVFATGGSWRWQMSQDVGDQTHELFWRQLARWLVSETPGLVSASMPKTVLSDETRVPLRVEVRNKEYQPMPDARVEARIVGPEGLAETVELTPSPHEEGVYAATWPAWKPGAYVAEVIARRNEEEVGRDTVQFRREEGVAEHFRLAQNRELLEKLAEQTGGRYWTPAAAKKLPEQISYSEAGITAREARDLWDMPAVFLLLAGLRATEWLLRRRWGVI